jgi:hypothetical protein
MTEHVHTCSNTGTSGTALLAAYDSYGFDGNLPRVDILFCPPDGPCAVRTLAIPRAFLEVTGAERSRACLCEAARRWANQQGWAAAPGTIELIPIAVVSKLTRFEPPSDGKTLPDLLVWLAPLVIGAPALIETLAELEIPLLSQHSRVIQHGLREWMPKAEGAK